MNRMQTVGRVLMVLVCLALLVGVIAWLSGVFTPKVEPGVAAPPEVQAPPLEWSGRVEQIAEPQIERAPGTLVARREATISARITATIARIDVRAADTVEAGQTLIELDSRDLEARQRQAEQQVSAAEARLEEARKQYERMQKLVEDGTIPRSQFDAAQAAWETARADVSRTEAATREAGAWRSYATIAAPFSGRIVDRLAEPGDTAMPGQPLLKMYDPARMRLEAYVRESLAGGLKAGQTLPVQIDALNQTFEGRIEEIVPQADPGSRSMLVKVALPETTGLYPGLFGRLVIEQGSVERLYLPAAAVYRVGQLAYVWTREGALDDVLTTQPVRRFVKLGEGERPGLVEALSGAPAGMIVGVPKLQQ